jgi:hypothetical protein
MKALEKLVTYTYVGVIPNTCAAIVAYQVSDGIKAAFNDGHPMIALAGTIPVLFNLAVGYWKYEEYRAVRRSLERHGWQERIVRPKMHSWCQRRCAREAALQSGYRTEFDAFAEREGYRWYHFTPDEPSAE